MHTQYAWLKVLGFNNNNTFNELINTIIHSSSLIDILN